MKKLILALPLLAAIMTPTHAQANEGVYKMNTIKRMYRDAAVAEERYYAADQLDTIYAYSNRELQNAVAITKADAMNPPTAEGGIISDCNEVRNTLYLSASISSAMHEISGIDFILLKNRKVRANMVLVSYDDPNSPATTTFKDFSLKCEGSSCKVTDIYDYRGKSGISDADKYCR